MINRKRWLKYTYGLRGSWHMNPSEDKWYSPAGWSFTDHTSVDFEKDGALLPIRRDNRFSEPHPGIALKKRLIDERKWP